MSVLKQLLDDVLTGRRVIQDESTFRLLRRIAPDKAAELDRLEVEAADGKQMQVEHKPNFAPPPAADPIYLTRDDLNAIIHCRRPGTVDELEWLLAHSGDLHLQLSDTEELVLRNLTARLLANRHLAEVRALEPGDDFIMRMIGTVRTKYGDLSREDIAQLQTIRLQATQAIRQCQDHKRQRCSCWKHAREALFELRCRTSEGSAVAMGALAIWNAIEALARNRPPERPVTEEGEPPPGIVYNWRHFKCPEYINANYPELGESTCQSKPR